MSATRPIQPLATSSQEQADEIRSLLAECGLPTSDITPSSSAMFFGHHHNGKLVGMIGLEIYDAVALLRSLAVTPEQRSHGLGRSLVKFAEEYAAKHGIETLYLLTTTASEFFSRLGYTNTAREDAPPSIKTTSQFSGLCPASSFFMRKRLR